MNWKYTTEGVKTSDLTHQESNLSFFLWCEWSVFFWKWMRKSRKALVAISNTYLLIWQGKYSPNYGIMSTFSTVYWHRLAPSLFSLHLYPKFESWISDGLLPAQLLFDSIEMSYCCRGGLLRLLNTNSNFFRRPSSLGSEYQLIPDQGLVFTKCSPNMPEPLELLPFWRNSWSCFFFPEFYSFHWIWILAPFMFQLYFLLHKVQLLFCAWLSDLHFRLPSSVVLRITLMMSEEGPSAFVCSIVIWTFLAINVYLCMHRGLDNQGLKGFLPDGISKLHHLQSLWVSF